MIERIGISLEKELLERFDKLITRRGYSNRSEAVRDLIRDQLVQEEWSERKKDDAEKVAVVTLVYDHESSSIAQRLTHIQHEHHGVVVSALHVHLDAHNCLEVLILRGRADVIVPMGESLVGTKGV
jgi:CopG family nickel-responsive transcriptional regulator